MPFGGVARQGNVKLAFLQRDFISLVAKANHPTFARAGHIHSSSINQTFDLEILLSDPGCLIPMHFSEVETSVLQTHPGDSLALAPAALTIHLSKSGQLSDRRAGSKRFDVCDFTEDLE